MPAFIIILAFLLLLAFLRVGMIAEYGDKSVVTLTVGVLRFKVYPFKKRKEKKEKAVKKEREKKKDEKRPGTYKDFLSLIPDIRDAAANFCRGLTISRLKIHYCAAAEDPADAALQFGAASVGAGLVVAFFENIFTVRKREILTSVDFNKTEPYLYIYAKGTIAVWKTLFIGLRFVLRFLKNRKIGKEVKENG